MSPGAGRDPIIWNVEAATMGAVDWVLLGDDPDDAYRVGVTIVREADGPEAEALIVYPCRDCGWTDTCGECHS